MARFALATLLVAAAYTAPARAAHDTPAATGHDDKWYPQTGSSKTCKKNDATLTSIGWVQSGTTGYATLEECCVEYYAAGDTDALETCVEDGDPAGDTSIAIISTGEWRVDWSVQNGGRCVKDCVASTANPECGGAVGGQTPSGITHYTDAAACCAAHYQWQAASYCEATANQVAFTGSGKYYIDTSSLKCYQDCDTSGNAQCNGVVTETYITLFDTLDLCCAASNNEDYCKGQSDPTIGGTDKWFIKESLCVKDCLTGATGGECADGASGWTKFFDTADSCCTSGLGWLNADYCKTRSQPDDVLVAGQQAGYTYKWSVDYTEGLCTQDCAESTNPSCKALKTNPQALYDDAAACCSDKLSYIGDACEASSVAGSAAASTGTSKWVADYANAKRCVLDCATSAGANCAGVVSNSAGVTFYDDAESCCKAKFGWYQQDLCKVLSENAGTGYTNLYYADYQSNTCKKDCATNSGGVCGGTPSDKGMPLYADIDDCCTTKLGWAKDSCIAKTTAVENGGSAADTGTNLWFVDYSKKACSKDCATGGADPLCAGVQTDTSKTMYDDVEKCCSAGFNWVSAGLCKAISEDTYSGKFYPDQGKGVCKQDCDSSGGDPCDGHPTDMSVPFYDDIADCCSTSIGWKDAATCEGIPLSAQGTDEWYASDQSGKCVKNCPTGSDSECGGMRPGNWNQLYSSASACCDSPRFQGTDFEDCKKS